MPVAIPPSLRRVLQDKTYGHVITFDSKGQPHTTMVWLDGEGDEVSFNTAEGRLKPKHLRRDPRIIISAQDPKDPQAYAVFHGKARITEAGADAQIDKLAKRFMGVDKYPYRQPGEKRLSVHVTVDRIGGAGPGFQPWK
jgi:PPOX class probable F420-dependent enzyme